MSHDHDDDILEEPEAEAEDEISELDSQGLPEEALAKPAETKPAALSLAGSSMQDSMLSQCIEVPMLRPSDCQCEWPGTAIGCKKNHGIAEKQSRHA